MTSSIGKMAPTARLPASTLLMRLLRYQECSILEQEKESVFTESVQDAPRAITQFKREKKLV